MVFAWLLLVFLLLLIPTFSEAVEFSKLQNLIESFKKDPRGPYQGIRWFYPDGAVYPARSPAPDRTDGMQHALHKDVVLQIQKEHGIYLGQILAGTKYEDFLDAPNQNSRMKQYQMEQYLRAVDDGWIFRRAQYYRGAFQAEDEEKWGVKFLTWLLPKGSMLESQFFLCRQVTQDIPHITTDNRLTRIRALAKNIAEVLPSFMDIRIKIHGQPDAADLDLVREFRKKRQAEISPEIDKQFQELQQKLEAFYQEPGAQKLVPYGKKIPKELRSAVQLGQLVGSEIQLDDAAKSKAMADLLWEIRAELPSVKSGATRLAMMDFSIELEAVLMRTIGQWKPQTVSGLMEKCYTLAKAAAGCGFVEVWEWEAVEPLLRPPGSSATVPLEELIRKSDAFRRSIYWGTGMVRASYEPTMELFSRFEPLAAGFVEERIRSSALLPYGDIVDELSDLTARLMGLSNKVLGIKNQNEIRGLNPGFAVGELEVVKGAPEEIVFSTKKIYILQRPPAEIKPVAGIATVTEGNLVSHVQLLARNLGIPNAAISIRNLNALAPFSGNTVFYAVSPRGKVVMKLASDMTTQEKELVEVRKRKEERVRVPTGKIDLKSVELAGLMELKASDSGRVCGPKAANLGQLRSLFPDKVAPGFVIPFGVFRKFMDLPMTGTDETFWDFLHATFAQTAKEMADGRSEEEIEVNVLSRLSRLQEAVKNAPLPSELIQKLRVRFREVFGDEMGQVPVFIRSDTNMEDLKEFTGAGLNLTVPNLLKEEDILQGIRNVWASPFRERSYRWRQKYLLNPENVYPSILILKSVNVDKSGVMITTGVVSSEPRDTTVAFNWGVGGAVDGQAAETYLLQYDNIDTLTIPAREPTFRSLPQQGGVEKSATHFGKPILSNQDRQQLRKLDHEIRSRLPGTPGVESDGPYDVELGLLNGSIWLFQVRPFVENKNARSTTYLHAMDPEPPKNLSISMSQKLTEQEQ